MELSTLVDDSGIKMETAKVVFSSLSDNTRRAYFAQLANVARWHGQDKPTDETMAEYLTIRFDEGTAPSTLRLALSSLRWLAKVSDKQSPIGKRTKAVMKMLAEKGSKRGRGQARPISYEDAVLMLRLAYDVDAAVTALLFMGGLRRSEVAALVWGDIKEAGEGGLLVHVRTSKTNRDGSLQDVRYLKDGFAKAIRNIKPVGADPNIPVFGCCPETINNRFKRAARKAGISGVSAHSGRVGLASELTSRGASTTEIMLAGAWKSSRMVAHYSAGARAQRGAVKKYF